jgi:hypothetical protein
MTAENNTQAFLFCLRRDFPFQDQFLLLHFYFIGWLFFRLTLLLFL